VQTQRVVPALDIAEAGHARLGLGGEFAAGEQFAFESGEEAPGHGVVPRVRLRRPEDRLRRRRPSPWRAARRLPGSACRKRARYIASLDRYDGSHCAAGAGRWPCPGRPGPRGPAPAGCDSPAGALAAAAAAAPSPPITRPAAASRHRGPAAAAASLSSVSSPIDHENGLAAAGRTGAEIARSFQVHRGTVSRIAAEARAASAEVRPGS
jgi:hypothetical protein